MTVDMGGIAWPLRSGPGVAATTPLGSAKLDRQVAYQGNLLTVIATGTDGQPFTGALEVVLHERDGAEIRRTVAGGSLNLAGVPTGRYRVTVNGTQAGPLRVL